jgi:thiol-disulfide isomerase/thioredoxin
MLTSLLFALISSFVAPQASGQLVVQAPASATTPTACLNAVRAHGATLNQQARATNPVDTALLVRSSREQAAMAQDCATRFDVAAVPADQLVSLIDLAAAANNTALAQQAIARALPIKTFSETDRAAILLQAVRIGLREPKGDERNARLETYVDRLDRLSDAAFDQKFSAHQSMNGYYRGDDIDAGIIRHSTWIIEAAKTFTPEQRAKYGLTVVAAHVDMAEALAGQGMNDKAIELLEQAKRNWSDIPRALDSYIEPTLERYRLVGTPGAAIAAPVWLNAPAGTTSMPMTGVVTLLEFTAHWCGPCRESYPGVNRLRERFGARGFRVVLVTRLWGYFGAERNIDATTEIAHDRDYFAEYHLDVPVAVAGKIDVKVENGKVVYLPGPDPNDTAYKVSGIPQIHLIDRQGRIRLIMVGYDDANEPALAKTIEGLLSERR